LYPAFQSLLLLLYILIWALKAAPHLAPFSLNLKDNFNLIFEGEDKQRRAYTLYVFEGLNVNFQEMYFNPFKFMRKLHFL
jgi:hypothetical protein